jgi:hypothetical protein
MLAGFFVALLSGHIYILIICKSHLAWLVSSKTGHGRFQTSKTKVVVHSILLI